MDEKILDRELKRAVSRNDGPLSVRLSISGNVDGVGTGQWTKWMGSRNDRVLPPTTREPFCPVFPARSIPA